MFLFLAVAARGGNGRSCCGRGQAADGGTRRNRKWTSPKFHMSRQQRTLRHVIGCAGVGLHSGARVGLTLCPAAESSGIRFRRVDRHGTQPITASLAHVSGADMGICLGHPAGGVHMIQHLMAAFAGYGFNKSHSAAYALLSFQTAYLKAHYPAAFMAAVLSADMDHTDKVVTLKDECDRMGLAVLAPDVNASGDRKSVV